MQTAVQTVEPSAVTDATPTNSAEQGAGVFAEPIIVVGAGPVGVRAYEEIRSRMPAQPVLIFGDKARAFRPGD